MPPFILRKRRHGLLRPMPAPTAATGAGLQTTGRRVRGTDGIRFNINFPKRPFCIPFCHAARVGENAGRDVCETKCFVVSTKSCLISTKCRLIFSISEVVALDDEAETIGAGPGNPRPAPMLMQKYSISSQNPNLPFPVLTFRRRLSFLYYCCPEKLPRA